MDTAEIYQFPAKKAQEPPEAKRGVQLEDGYTRIPNDLLTALIQMPVTDRERRVALAVARLTYGWNKEADRIADSQIAEEAGMQRKRANAAKQSLIAKKVIKSEGAGYGLLSINKHLDEWELTAKHTPSPKGDKKGGSIPHAGDKTCTPRGHTPKTKDIHMNTYVFIAHRLPANALVDLTNNPFKLHPVKRKAKAALPPCPHHEIIDLWAEIMPDKQQPAKNLWAGTTRQRDLANRWKAGFTIKHERTGKPLYATREEGIAWWGRFFAFLRKSEWLMQDHRWFKLDWVVNKTNFTKIMELSYHGQGGAA